jgi:hypothetical protein
MLEKIATEDHVETIVGEAPGSSAVLLKKSDLWIEFALGVGV